MKDFKKIVPITLVTLFILTACSAPVDEVTEDSGATEVAIELPVSRYGDDLNCDLIKDEQSRKICELQINDMIGGLLESEIVSRFDLARCKELEKKIGTNCQTIISESGVEGPISDDELANFTKAVQGILVEPGEDEEVPSVFLSYDSAKCAALKTPGYKEYCEKQINNQLQQLKFDEIVSSGDVNRCDELAEEQLDQCKILFGGVELFEGTPDDLEFLEPDEEPVAPEIE